MKNKSQTRESVLALQKNERIIYNHRILATIIVIINNKLKNIIQKEYLKNKQTQKVLKKFIKRFKKINKSLLLFQELIYMLKH